MIFQEILMEQIIVAIVVSIISVILGILIIRWWVMKNDWNDSYKPPIILMVK